MDAQIKKGLIDICVLAVLNRGDTYGWQVIKDLENIVAISEGTLYPVLKRLEVQKLIEPYEVPHNGRLRKYFKILPAGAGRLAHFAKEQEQLLKIYKFIELAQLNAGKTKSQEEVRKNGGSENE